MSDHAGTGGKQRSKSPGNQAATDLGAPMIQHSEVSVSRPLADLAPEFAGSPGASDEPQIEFTPELPWGPATSPTSDEAALAPNLSEEGADTGKATDSPAAGAIAPRAFADPEPRIPSPTLTFDGINASSPGAGLPPDPTGAAGPNHYMQATNRTIAVYDKTGGTSLSPFASSAIWAGMGGICSTSNSGDPIVLYDRAADRFFYSEVAFNRDGYGAPIAPFYTCMAVSATGNPTGAWNRYSFVSPTGQLMDYPKYGRWTDGYHMTSWLFNMTTGAFEGMLAAAFDRNAMIAGSPMNSVWFQTGSAAYGLIPADIDGGTLPPPGVGNPMVGLWTGSPLPDTVVVYRLNANWAIPSMSSLVLGGVVGISPLPLEVTSAGCPDIPRCVHQLGTSQRLDSIPIRPMQRLVYRNLGSYESLVFNMTGFISQVAMIRWVELRGVSSVPFLFQEGNQSSGSEHFWMGSLAIDGAGSIALGYSRSSPFNYPAIAYAGRRTSDALGTMGQGSTTMNFGVGAQTHSSGRWGDYSHMSIDPADDCTFWYTNEYYSSTSSTSWRTRIGKFSIPGCSTSAPPAPSGVTARADDQQVSLFWTNPVATGFTGVRVVRKVGASPPASVSDGVTVFDGYASTYTDVGLTNGTQYSYGLFSHNGLPAYSAPSTATETPATHAGLPYNAYLAEGYTGNSGFASSEYLTLGNVDPGVASTVIATYYIEGRAPQYRTYTVNPQSRRTVHVNAELGGGVASGVRIATQVGPGVIVERPMYFAGNPGVTPLDGGHDSVAAPKPSNEWYFAEGYTGTGFVEYLTILNPSGEAPSTVQATYAFTSGAPLVKNYVVQPGQRMTINAASEVGSGRDVSTKFAVISGPPVVAERPMYFGADPVLGTAAFGGHVTLGATSPANTWLFAEGYTGPGFVEWLTLQNPNGSASTATITYAFSSGPPLVKVYPLPANSRTTLRVNDEIGAPGRDVSVRIDVTGPPIVAERPMYFNADPVLGAVANGGHVVVGASTTGASTYFAEGYTGTGFVEWMTLQNPDSVASTVNITYYFDVGAPSGPNPLTLPPQSRTTIRVNSVVPSGREVSVKIETTSGPNPLVERPMYFNANPGVGTGVSGGHDVVGFN
ncbi:MAG: hypothetical protein DCC49_02940 [Acidobacteria bacterium]|nr:MAG: hypothetical protein DCC49_02940 [Acidobacteriota bacterium]